MKKKIIGILVCTLLIAAISTPLVSSHSIEKSLEIIMPSVIDQEQPNTPELDFLEPGLSHWQQFKNKGNMLEEVDLHIGCWFSGSPDITLSIKENPTGSAITQVTYQAAALPLDYQDWFTFDVPDVKLKPNNIYYIILTVDLGSEYGWSGSHSNPYPLGISSHPDIDWDYAFKTIVDKKPRALDTPFQNFLENHLNIFSILKLLWGL